MSSRIPVHVCQSKRLTQHLCLVYLDDRRVISTLMSSCYCFCTSFIRHEDDDVVTGDEEEASLVLEKVDSQRSLDGVNLEATQGMIHC